MRIKASEALQLSRDSKEVRRFPDQVDNRFDCELLLPKSNPTFTFEKGSKLFTLGSCFARNIENALQNFDLPTTKFKVPITEWLGQPRKNALLNEYNVSALESTAFSKPHNSLSSRHCI